MAVIEITESGLRKLDFTPKLPCEVPGCGGAAAVVWRCKRYHSGARLACDSCHAIASAEAQLLVESGTRVSCATCEEVGAELADVLEVIEL
ncbi:hypothetical protein ACWGOE_07400 [Leucobacter chromiiresistens]